MTESGIHGSGDCVVKQEIAWPHHHCFPEPGGQMPEYKGLSPLHFMLGFLGCLQEERSNTVQNIMIDYGRHLKQDAIKMNWHTACHAHMLLLQDIERGKCLWCQPDQIEKIAHNKRRHVLLRKNLTHKQQVHKTDLQ